MVGIYVSECHYNKGSLAFLFSWGWEMAERIATDYRGVVYRIAKRISGKGEERVYYVRYKKDGKKYEEKVGRQYADNMTPAKANNIRSELIEGKRLTRKEQRLKEENERKAHENSWTLNRLWQEYKAQKTVYKGLGSDESRYKHYLKKPFGDKEPKELNPLDVDRVRMKMLKAGKSPQSVRLTLALLRRLANFGANKRLTHGLSFKIEMPKVNNIKTEDLTPDQFKALLEAINEDRNIAAGNIMKMALFTGMRRGEIFKLKWADIDEINGFIKIRDPKGGIDQKIPLNDAARDLLKEHPSTGSEYVFPGRSGGQRVDIHHEVNRIRDNAGLPKDFRALHGLRHVFASMLASSGKVDLYTLQRLLTHKSPSMTMRYAHLRDQALKDASSVAADIVNEAMRPKKKAEVVNLEARR
jgi:integrase